MTSQAIQKTHFLANIGFFETQWITIYRCSSTTTTSSTRMILDFTTIKTSLNFSGSSCKPGFINSNYIWFVITNELKKISDDLFLVDRAFIKQNTICFLRQLAVEFLSGPGFISLSPFLNRWKVAEEFPEQVILDDPFLWFRCILAGIGELYPLQYV